MMTDEKHRLEVAALVERMVDERSQCRLVHIRTGSTTSSSSASSSVAVSPVSTAPSSVSSSPIIDEGCRDMELDCGAESDSAVDYPSRTLKFRRSGDLSMMPMGVVKRDVRLRKPRRQRASGGSGRPWEI